MQFQARFAALAAELRACVDGEVYERPLVDNGAEKMRAATAGFGAVNAETERKASDPYQESTTVFNSAAPVASWIVVRPESTEGVTAALAFCRQHGLSPSVRSGGFSTAGWATQGDVMLDMRRMNQVRMLPISASPSPSKLSSSSPLSSSVEPCAVPESSKGRSVVGDEGEQSSFKRRKSNPALLGGEQESDEQSHPPQADGTLPRTGSHESGADADAEDSNGSQSGSRSDEAASESADKQVTDSVHSPSNKKVGTSQNHSAPLSRASRSAAAREWAESIGNDDPNSGSSSSGLFSRESASANGAAMSDVTTAAETEIVEDKMDVRRDLAQQVLSQQQDALDSNPDEAPWARHHCPPAGTASGSRTKLPSTGGFVWTAGNGADQQASTRPLSSNDPVYLGGATLPDLQAAQGNPVSSWLTPSMFTSKRESSLSASGSGSGSGTAHTSASPMLSGLSLKGFSSANRAEVPLAPGIHKDKARLVEFGPGVGVRDLDMFTSDPVDARNSKSASYVEGKGKSRLQENRVQGSIDGLEVHSGGLDFRENGVPYHVPLSAYPVGSTAMTIGGFGYLSRAYGLSLDNIVELELVLADGQVMTLNEASAQSSNVLERELWWAVRGAAPCFGIVTRIVAKAYPVPKVYAGNLIFPFNKATAPSLLRHWRDCLKGTGGQIPRELYSNLILTAGPGSDENEHVIVVQICYLGSSSTEEVGASFVQAMSSWTGERMLLKDVSEKSFISQQDGVAQVLKSGYGRRWMVRGDLLTTLTDEMIARSVAQFVEMGNRAVWLFELIGGAIEDMAAGDATCVGRDQRHAKFTAAALQQWKDEAEDTRCVRGVEQWVNEVLAPASVGGPFAAFLERGENRQRCEGSFGADNLRRLIQLKRRVDPNGVFTHTFGRGLQEFVEQEDRELELEPTLASVPAS